MAGVCGWMDVDGMFCMYVGGRVPETQVGNDEDESGSDD